MEPYNEQFATELLKRFCRVPFVEYKVDHVLGKTVSVCESFIGKNMELVTAADLIKFGEQPKRIPASDRVMQRCELL